MYPKAANENSTQESNSDSDSESQADGQSNTEDSDDEELAPKKTRKHPHPVNIEDIKQPTLPFNDEEVDISMEQYLQKHSFLLPESVAAWTENMTGLLFGLVLAPAQN